MHLKNLSSHLEGVAGIRRVFQIVLAASFAVNVILALTILTFDKTVRNVFVPPTIEKSFWVDGKVLGAGYLEQMGLWVAQMYASVTPSSVSYQNSLLLKNVHPAVHGSLSVRLEAGANKIKSQALSTFFMPREVRISEKGQAVAFIGTQSTWVSDQRAPDAVKAYVVVFAYDGSMTYVKEVRAADPLNPLGASLPVASHEYEDEGRFIDEAPPSNPARPTASSLTPLADVPDLVPDLPPPPQALESGAVESLQSGDVPPITENP